MAEYVPLDIIGFRRVLSNTGVAHSKALARNLVRMDCGYCRLLGSQSGHPLPSLSFTCNEDSSMGNSLVYFRSLAWCHSVHSPETTASSLSSPGSDLGDRMDGSGCLLGVFNSRNTCNMARRRGWRRGAWRSHSDRDLSCWGKTLTKADPAEQGLAPDGRLRRPLVNGKALYTWNIEATS